MTVGCDLIWTSVYLNSTFVSVLGLTHAVRWPNATCENHITLTIVINTP